MEFDESETKRQKEAPAAPAAGALISPPAKKMIVLQVAMLPFTMLLYLLSNFKSFLSNMRIPVLTEEQEHIMKSTPHEQKTLRTSMKKVTVDQEKIGNDIGDLRARLARMEDRRRARNEALEILKAD